MSSLTIHFRAQDDNFHVCAKAGDFETELSLNGRATGILEALNRVYEILDKRQRGHEEYLVMSMRDLGEELLGPLAEQVEMADLVRFVIDEELIRCPFDLLYHNDTFLFLQKRICFQITQGVGEDEPKLLLNSALLIADLSADPEEACLQVSKLIPNSIYKEVGQADLALIREHADEVDALIVSGHGQIDDKNGGSIRINGEEIKGNLIEELDVWIVYFDSCKQGANLDFVKALQNKCDVQFYLGPIISNDAGDSSTKTLLWFFADVRAHGDPIRALADTRKKLFEHYSTNRKLDLVISLNKAFPFRLYEFIGVQVL